MNTLSASQQYFEEIRKLLAYLSAEEQLRLISEISIKLQKIISTQPSEKKTPITQAGTVRGKYAYVPTSSGRFAQRKQEEIESTSLLR